MHKHKLTDALPPEPPNGRRVVEWARIYGVHPSKFHREIRRPKRLSDGRRITLRATFDGGSYRVRQIDLECYQSELTADRIDRSAQSAPRSTAAVSKSFEDAERQNDAA